MIHVCVPDFELKDECRKIKHVPPSHPLFLGAAFSLSPFEVKNRFYAFSFLHFETLILHCRQEEEVMELLWQDGEVVMQRQKQKSVARKSPPSKFDATSLAEQSMAAEIRYSQQHQEEEEEKYRLFTQEQEMASWLQYPLVDDPNLCADLLYPTSQCVNINANTFTPVLSSHAIELRPSMTVTETATETTTVIPMPPIQPTRRMDSESKLHNFVHFTRHKPRFDEFGPSGSKSVMRGPTVVDSSDTPAIGHESADSEIVRRSVADASNNDFGYGIMSGGGVTDMSPGGGGSGGKETTTCEVTVSSSSGVSSTSAEPTTQMPAFEDRERKAKEVDDTECHSEDVDFESPDAKKQVRGSTSTKRARVAEVHNLSERRRRDRINRKMKALQELIPRCNKSDKASILDEAIEYLKSLQLQVQMMSMGYGMMPMMHPGVQQFMPHMGMRMGMGMGMGMNRPMMPFPNMLNVQRPAAAAQLRPCFPIPAFHMPPITNTDQYRIQPASQPDHMLNSLGTQSMDQPRVSSFMNAYQQYPSPRQMHPPVLEVARQDQQAARPSANNLCTSMVFENLENLQLG